MKKEDREFLELRQKTLDLNDRLSMIVQASWRLKKIKDRYSFSSESKDDWLSLYAELESVRQHVIKCMSIIGGDHEE